MTFIMLPVGSVITQPFGTNPTRDLPASHPTIQTYGNYQPWGHDGIDFGCWAGTPVRVPGRGVVAFSGFGDDMPYDVCIKYGFSTVQSAKWASGIIVILDHGNGIASYYAHLSRSDLDHRVGQWVEAGTVLGLSGNTGRSGGDHLHWSAVDLPVNYNDGLYSRRNPLDLVTAVTVTPITPGNTGSPSKPAPKEWDEMASKDEIKAALREVIGEPTTKTKLGEAVWHRATSAWNGHVSLEARLTGMDAALNNPKNTRLKDALKGLDVNGGNVSAKDIAAAIPEGLAKSVADELAKRMAA